MLAYSDHVNAISRKKYINVNLCLEYICLSCFHWLPFYVKIIVGGNSHPENGSTQDCFNSR